MDSRLLLLLAILVAVILPATIFTANPGVDYYPYEPDTATPSYAIAHESTPAYESTVERAELDPNDSVPVDELSPESQRLVEEAKDQPVADAGWQRIEINVCSEFMLVCTAYADQPTFPEQGAEHPDSGTSNYYSLVEDDGEQYVVETHHDIVYPIGYLGVFILNIFAAISFAAYGIYLLLTAYSYHDSQPRRVVGCTGYGLLLIGWPYLVMFSGREVSMGTRPYLLILLSLGGIAVTKFWYDRSEPNATER